LCLVVFIPFGKVNERYPNDGGTNIMVLILGILAIVAAIVLWVAKVAVHFVACLA
jgi:hypothetical protein